MTGPAVDDQRTRRPKLVRHSVLRFDSVRDRDVLLLPERIVLLNATSAAVLRLCDGQRTVNELITELHRQFPASEGLANDVGQFLVEAASNGWLEP